MTAELLVFATAAWLDRAQDRCIRCQITKNRALRKTGADVRRLADAHLRMQSTGGLGLSPSNPTTGEPIAWI